MLKNSIQIQSIQTKAPVIEVVLGKILIRFLIKTLLEKILLTSLIPI